MSRWSRRFRALGVFGLLALAAAYPQPMPPEQELKDFCERLGGAAHGVVAPEEIRWEPSGGVVSDFVVGRFVLFLSRESAEKPRDLFRARVRLTPEGRPIGIDAVYNLTSTPLGDDHALVMHGDRAAFATLAYDQEQSVTLLALDGEGGQDAALTLPDRLTNQVTNFQKTGALEGIARVDITFEQPPRHVGLALADTMLDIEMENEKGGVRRVGVRGARGDVELDTHVPGIRVEAARHLPKRLIHWAVDTVRAISWIGPAPIAWLEERAFGAKDAIKRFSYRLRSSEISAELADPSTSSVSSLLATGGGDTGAVPSTAQGQNLPLRNLPLSTNVDASDSPHAPDSLPISEPFPPARIASIWKTAEPGEGEWVEPALPWLKRLTSAGVSAPSGFMQTFVRPDEQRPYSKVLLLAMDMRQFDLQMEAGTEDPKPLVGSNGSGRLPRDPNVLRRVAGAFNGGFKTEHGNYGMMVNRRVLLPPQPSAATVVVLDDHRVGLGTWGPKSDVAMAGFVGMEGESIVSYRQNLDPLLDVGRLNPTKRTQWGFTLPGTGMQTERSGLCVTPAGALIYAWGDDSNAIALGKAMDMAGCNYGLHLDMNPHHTGFVFTAIEDLKDVKSHAYKAALLTKEMEIWPDRYITSSQKDFFYLLLREPSPPAVASVTWSIDPGAQPPPTWIPAIWRGDFETQDEPTDGIRNEAQDETHDKTKARRIEVLNLAPGRVSFRIRAGGAEPDPKTGVRPPKELSSGDSGRVLAAVGLGVALPHRPRGLTAAGTRVWPLSDVEDPTLGLLIAGPDRALRIVRGNELTADDATRDSAELPLVLDGGAILAPAERRGPREERAALGITQDGRVLMARGVVTRTAPLAEALQTLGCVRAVALDRGHHGQRDNAQYGQNARGGLAPFLHRSATASPPQNGYEQSVLYVMAEPMMPRAFRFEARVPVAARTNAQAQTSTK